MITRIVMEYDAPCFKPLPGADLQPVLDNIRSKVSEGIFPNIAGQQFPARVSVVIVEESEQAGIDSAFAEILMQVANECGHRAAIYEDNEQDPTPAYDLIVDRLSRGQSTDAYSRRCLVEAAALCVQSILSFDQKHANLPKEIRCPMCRGIEIPEQPCGACGGSGWIDPEGP